MPQADLQDILKKVSTDNDFQIQFLSALDALSKEDQGFRKQLLNTLASESSENSKKREQPSLFSNVKKEAVFQVILTGILTLVFILLVYVTFGRIDDPPKPADMGEGRIEMYDSYSRAKDLLTLILPLFTTVLSFWLGFSIQEKRVNQAEVSTNEQRQMREKADKVMAKIEGRMMTTPENDDINNLSNDIHKIMES